MGKWEELKRRAAERLGPEMVFGEGPLEARIAVIGEAPGGQEAKEGRPFVGPAGRLLEGVLEEAGIGRSGVYLTNVVKLRPTVEGRGRLKNRPPRAGEVQEGLEVLGLELQLVSPSVLVLLGNVPAKALIGRSFAMRAGRGVLSETRLGIPAIPTYHPAYLLRLSGDDLERVRGLVVEDLGAAREISRRRS